MSDNSSEDEITSGESNSTTSKEKISDMDDLDCLEDV